MDIKKHIRIEHTTRHDYSGLVSFSDHSLYLRPTDSLSRKVLNFKVETVPASRQRWVRDVYGNHILVCNFGLTESKELSFKTQIEMEVANENPFDFVLESYATGFPFKYSPVDEAALASCMGRSATKGAGKVIDWFYMAVANPNQHTDVVQFLTEINSAIRRDISYTRRDEEGIQTPDQTLQLRTGSCRDMAVLFVSAVRQLGMAARFVSGYLYDPPVEGSAEEHVFNRAVGSMHAWAEVYLPGAGWKGFDPTNGILANGYFIPSAVSHEPSCVDPIQGKYYADGAESSTMEVNLEIDTLS
jgi:hypothetical protein